MTRLFLGNANINRIEGWIAARPLIPLLAAPLAAFLLMPIAYSILKPVFWVLSAILMYHVTLQLAGSHQQALAAAPLFTASPPTLLYFGSVMLEARGMFFTLLILWTYPRLQDRLDRLSSRALVCLRMRAEGAASSLKDTFTGSARLRASSHPRENLAAFKPQHHLRKRAQHMEEVACS
jgi:hypothetical protein